MKAKKFKMPSTYTLLFLIVVVVAILTWIVPAGQYEYVDPEASKLQPIAGTFSLAEQNPQGIWDVLLSPVSGFMDAVDIAFYLLIIGGYLAVVVKSGAIDAGIGKVIRRLKGREHLLIPILMVLFAIGGTTFGMCEEAMGFYLILIPVFVAAGYDSLTAVYVVALGAGLGTLGSTVNPFATGIASGFAGISVGDGLLLRVLILIVTLIIGIIFVMRYAKAVKENPENSVIYDKKTENEAHFLGDRKEEIIELTKKRQVILWVFGLTFFIMILGVIPWAGKFDITFFEDLVVSLAAIPFIGPLLGHMVPLGDWWFGELGLLFLTAAIVTGFIACKDEDEFFDAFLGGARDVLGVAIIIGISRGLTIVMNDGGMTATVLHLGEVYLSGVGKTAFAILSYIFYLPLALLLPSTTGLATLSMPIIAPLCDFVGVSRDIAVTSFQSASGLINLATPTSGVIMGALALGRIPYDRFIRHVWKLLVILSVVIIVFMGIAVNL